jgi:hypothetical protein
MGKSRPYAVTEWTRQAVGPLVAAGRCECAHIAEGTDRLTEEDIEAALQLAVPLVTLPPDHSGSCLLAVDAEAGEEPDRQAIGVQVTLNGGGVVSCVAGFEHDPGTWVLGPVDAWVEAIVDGRFDDLRIGGSEQELAQGLLESLHRSVSVTG